MTDSEFELVEERASAHRPGIRISPSLEQMLITRSHVGPVGYIEAEYFGGAGGQGAAVWDRGVLVVGPLVNVGEAIGIEGTPISQALRYLGVVRSFPWDEFDAAGLGRHRRTTAWLR
ncbi:hypothetical protein [Catellatospora sp. TT07R-123]|uniref:hypothetical protein n=1 Tax=Catellatospora sp. TT07R-123 TaxID=2733863 RepID=UPI001BB30392|nr:hypothetical protein [Catellatospora sp. TT07R-123]